MTNNLNILHTSDPLSMSSAEPCEPQGDELWVDTETNLVMELTTQELKAFDKTQRVRKLQ